MGLEAMGDGKSPRCCICEPYGDSIPVPAVALPHLCAAVCPPFGVCLRLLGCFDSTSFCCNSGSTFNCIPEVSGVF